MEQYGLERGEASAFERPMPLAVGQYTSYRLSDGDKRSVLRSAVVGEHEDGWIIESYSLTPSVESTTQMLVTGLDKTWETLDPTHLDIQWVKTKQGDGDVKTVEGTALAMTKKTYRNMLANVFFHYESIEGTAAVRVPAGTFNGCTKAVTTVKHIFWSNTVESYYHNVVPLSGIVRSLSLDDGALMELVEFGTSGATASF